jgi:hypothetical protein
MCEAVSSSWRLGKLKLRFWRSGNYWKLLVIHNHWREWVTKKEEDKINEGRRIMN